MTKLYSQLFIIFILNLKSQEYKTKTMVSNPNISLFTFVLASITCSLFYSHFLVEAYNFGPPNLSLWCKKTPYPKQCEYFLSYYQYSLPIKEKQDFVKIMMQTAIKNVERAHQNLYLSRNLYNDARERGALRDCSELYELSIKYLNNTINTRNCTQVDVQTWLSSALTQVQTCQYGFRDLGGDERAMPTALLYDIQNVSCLISNALAINGDVSSVSSLLDRSKDKFPRWIGLGDQKSSSSGRANLLVVAQDGSGDYRTIGEAINEASRRNRNGRFVINIKTGIYKEYLEIGSKLENIMLLGDGIGKTIITGSKSVGGGTTTYGSATVGKFKHIIN